MKNRLISALRGTLACEHRMRNCRHLVAGVVFAGTLLTAGAIAHFGLRFHVLDKQHAAETEATRQAGILEAHLAQSLSSTYALASLLRQGKGNIDRFDDAANEIRRQYGGISSLQLAADGIVSHVSPPDGNEKILGHDLLKDPRRNREAFTAVQTRRMTLAGPLELIQGGKAVIGRLPVFLPGEGGSGGDRFWGFATALIQVSDLLSQSNLSQLGTLGYQYELASAGPAGEPLVVFAGTAKAPLAEPVMRTINVPNGQWLLRIEPAGGWTGSALPASLAALVLLLAAGAALAAYSVFGKSIRLCRHALERRRRLEETTRALDAESVRRAQIQQEAQHLRRMYSVLSQVGGAIIKATDRGRLMDDICRIACEHGGFPLVRVALPDAQCKSWQWVARRGSGAALPDCGEHMPACMAEHDGSAILRVCTADRGGGPQRQPICLQTRSEGFHSHVMLLLRIRGRAAGVLSLYAHEADRFDAAQMRLLCEMADNVSYALESMERETLRKHAEEALRKLARAVEQSPNAVMITGRTGIIEYVNPWFTRITGYTAQEIVGKTPAVLKSAETDPATHQSMSEALKAGREWRGELHNVKKNGDSCWCLETISPLKNDAGDVSHFVAVIEDITERRQSEQTIQQLAFHDPLTGLANRRMFNDRLFQACAVRRRWEHPFALMLLDIDRFKTVNDTLGHDVGDALLKAVAARLLKSVREGDMLARMGGDEFALFATGLDHPDQAASLAGKLLQSLEAPFPLYGNEVYVTGSIGLTLFPSDTASADALIRNADMAMYRAKDLGRNRFQFFTDDMDAAILQRVQLENSMRTAIDHGEFMLHYQPQVDVVTGRIRGTEALIRWRHPELGLVSPAKFIPLAEETGMIVEIGEWTLNTACAQAKGWENAGVPMHVAVNLSARQFQQGDLAALVDATLKKYDLAPSLLEVELTEGILMEDTAETAATLDKLNRMGVQISIDDFGTGYSSLSYLKRLPIQILKIDQSFVRDIHTNPDDRTIVTAVIALAHSMGLKVIAEGVETQEQLAFLREYSCDIMQGYLYSKPVSGDDVLALLQGENQLAA